MSNDEKRYIQIGEEVFDLNLLVDGAKAELFIKSRESYIKQQARAEVIGEILARLSESDMEVLTVEFLAPKHFKKIDKETSNNIAFHYACGAGDMSQETRKIITKLSEGK